MVKYSLAMGIRVLCIVAVLFVHGWWLLIPALGAIFLPYFAVVIANNSWFAGGADVEQPGGIVLRDPALPGAGSAQPPPSSHGFDSESRGDEPKTEA